MEKQKEHFRNSFVGLVCGLALMLISTVAVAQNRQVTGVVKDATGETVIGASVVEKGNTGNGSVTNIDGQFSISVPSNATLTISFIGYQAQDVALNGRVNISVVLREDAELLDEVVVVGYGVQRKSDVTGAIASVRSDDIKGLATTDAAAALQGKAAGIQILNSSGAPGAGAQIRVRGYSSNSGNLSPLLIVDGLKVDNIQYLDPSMIESMEILKDAASAAIYGAEAGNGVVLITTKSGSSEGGRPKITYQFRAVNQSLGKTPEIFGADDWLKYKEMAVGADALAAKLSDVGYDSNNPIDTDWVGELMGTSWSTQHGITFQDGNDKGHFFTSINYVDNDGIVKGKKDTYQRLTSQINVDYQLYDWIKVGTNTNIEKWSTNTVSGANAYGSAFAPALLLDPLTPVYWDSPADFPTALAEQYKNNPDWVPVAANGKFYATSKFQEDENGNPLYQRDRPNSSNTGYNVRGTAFADLTPIKGLVVTSRFSYRIAQGSSHSYTVPYFLNTMAKTASYSISAGANLSQYYQWENFANYNKVFGKHMVGAMAGMSFTESRSDNVTAGADSPNEGEKILKGDAPNFQYVGYLLDSAKKNVGNTPSTATSLSYFGRLLYSFDNRYSLQANFRADAFDTSKLSIANRWGKFPSLAAGWTISNESFVKDNISTDILSFLKFRASWGRNGNINVLNNYQYASSINLNATWYQYGDQTTQYMASYPNGMSNPNLTWEQSEQLDFGLDMRFLSNRLSMTLDYYDKTTKNLLFQLTPAPEVYHMTTWVNGGEVKNKGFEVEAAWRDHIGELAYSINANFSTLSNEVTYIYVAVPRQEQVPGAVSGMNTSIATVFEEGYPIWYFRGYDYAGVDKETGEARFYNKEGEIVPGEQLLPEDRKYIGSALPKYTYGVTLNLMYKGFDFSLFGTGVGGNKIINVLYRPDSHWRNSLKYYYDNAWTQDNKNASMPAPSAVVQDKYFWSSSAAMFDGSYFKIKQIQLGYTIPKRLTQKAAIKDLRLFVSLDDFFTFSSYPGMDPETATLGPGNGAGFDIGTYPTMKKITLGASIAF
jgi:TonB-linked SusC/RagA family outer membrane protein